MNTSGKCIWAAGTAALLFILPGPAVACPHCNIHNYLGSSVKSSTNIFEATILREIDEKTAEVEVTKTLRGGHKAGGKVQTVMYGGKNHIGKKFIFSDPTSWPPKFEVLPLECEEEILFLLQKEPAIKDMKEGVRVVQMISVQAQGAGRKYIEEHHEAAVPLLIAELNSLAPQVFSTNEVFFGEYRLGKLFEALLVKPTDAGKQYVLGQLEVLTKRGSSGVDWKSIPYGATSRGVFLRDILKEAQKQKELSPLVLKRMQEIYPALAGLELADATYAMVLSGSEKIETLQAKAAAADKKDPFALGLYFAGNYASSWWAHEQAYKCWDAAAEHAVNLELRKKIAERIKDSEGFFKRPEKTNKPPDENRKNEPRPVN